MLRIRRRLSFISLASVALLVAAQPAPAFAAANAGCGGNSDDAIAAAEKALQTNNAEAQRDALACLIVAVKLLKEDKPRIVKKNGNDMFVVPQNSGGPGR
jgi:hypothetical protein